MIVATHVQRMCYVFIVLYCVYFVFFVIVCFLIQPLGCNIINKVELRGTLNLREWTMQEWSNRLSLSLLSADGSPGFKGIIISWVMFSPDRYWKWNSCCATYFGSGLTSRNTKNVLLILRHFASRESLRAFFARFTRECRIGLVATAQKSELQ